MTSPRPSSSVCSGWQQPGSFPETSSASHPGPHPPPFAGAPLWAGAAVLSGLVASVVWLVKPVLGCRSAGVGVARSGGVPGVHEGGNGSGDAGGSAGGEAVGGDGVRGVGAGADRGGGTAVSGADAGGGACDGAASGLAGSPSSPSCARWCSCSHLTWQQGGESVQPSTSFWLLNALAGLGEKHRDC